MSSSTAQPIPTSPVRSPSKKLLKKESKSSLRNDGAITATSPLFRLRKKLFAVKATSSDDGTEVEVIGISHSPFPTDEVVLSSPPRRNTSLKVKIKNAVSSSSAHRERPDEYLRQALQSASLKRSKTLPYTPFTPSPHDLPSTSIPIRSSSFSRASDPKQGTVTRFVETTNWSSPKFILAVDPDWDPTVGEATLFIFPQDTEDLHGEGDCITLEEIWSGFFPGLICDETDSPR